MRSGHLAEQLASARAIYPEVSLPDDAFFAHVEEKAKSRSDVDLRTTDLFLACACARGDAAAIARFERETFDEVEAAYRRFNDAGISLDDVKQRMREKLFLGERPQIAGYAGVGALRGWVRAAALHMLLNVVQRETREEPTDGDLFEVVLGSSPSAENAYMKLACREEFEAAFASAMSCLDDREKTLLRHAFVDGRSVDDIGAIYGVHRATAARWVGAARTRLVESTRTELIRRLGITEAEARSIIVAALSGVGSMLLRRLT